MSRPELSGMKRRVFNMFLRVAAGGLLLVLGSALALSQSQALDGQIEGIVTDQNGSILTRATVTAINVETGAQRTSVVNDEGIYRFLVLSLGSYTLSAENSGFKRFEQRGIILSAGQTVSVTIVLKPGRPDETVSVTSDAPIADISKFEIGRIVNSREVNNLPLVSRNPYNFMLLQPGVAGRTVKDPLVVDMSANGLRRRVGYQIDGNYDNEANQGGFRLNLISPIYVREVQLLSNGYSAEFGNTAGAVVNLVTPSGTNTLDGTATLLFRPSGLTSKPFGFKPGTASNTNGYGPIVSIGGPIIRDRWHFYSGYEWVRRNTATPITITDSNQAALIAAGLPPTIFVNARSTSDTQPYFIFRSDARVSNNTRINVRYNLFDGDLLYSGIGNLSTTQRSSNLIGYDHAVAAQAVTSISDTFINEFRFQFAKRIARTVSNDLSGAGPSVIINSIANFGPGTTLGQFGPNESSIQFQNAVTKEFKTHSAKLGGGVIFVHDRPRSAITSIYTFPSIQLYDDAVRGINPKGYSTYTETFGDSVTDYRGTFLNFFVQDDWMLSRRAKLSVGLRYELYLPPAADAASPLVISRRFNVDANNFAPRIGLAYLLRDGKYRSVVRIGGGLHYDPPFLKMYSRAIQNNGNPRFFSFSFQDPQPDPNAPAFPNRVGNLPAGTVFPKRDVDTVAPDFKTMYAVHSNVQMEQAIGDNMSLAFGYIYSNARHIPVYRNINCLPAGGTLADGRPLYGVSGLCTNRIFPQFNLVKIAESAGNLNYHAVFIQVTKRFSSGVQFAVNYTRSHARDDAPEENGPGSLTQSDPSNRALDRGSSSGDVPSTFSMSLVARPSFKFANRLLNTLLNNNQISLIALADSGENFNITTVDLNRDGVTGPDRPVGVPRNSGRLPAFLGVDARYSRFLKLNEKMSIEIYAEGTNILNAKYVSSYNGTILTANNTATSQVNPRTGELLRPLPDFRHLSPTWRDSRQIQLGASIHF